MIWWLIGPAFLLALLCLLVIRTGSRALTRPRPRADAEPFPEGWEPLTIAAADGARLVGHWRPSPTPRGPRALILLHGFAETSGDLLDRADAMHARGWGILLADARATGQSEGKHVTFGAREGEDVSAWIDVLADRLPLDARFAAWGRSMGAAVALRAASRDSRIEALVLEAPYADFRRAVVRFFQLSKFGLLAILVGPILRAAKFRAGVALDRPSPLDLAPGISVPALVIHGTDDRLVSAAEARLLAEAFRPPAQRIEVQGARHTDVFEAGGEGLSAEIGRFLDQAPGPAPG